METIFLMIFFFLTRRCKLTARDEIAPQSRKCKKCQLTAQAFQNFPGTAIQELIDKFIKAYFSDLK
jgi:hypothetical protein